jgi:DNA-directed RNA polymerase subunit E'/Rpb7
MTEAEEGIRSVGFCVVLLRITGFGEGKLVPNSGENSRFVGFRVVDLRRMGSEDGIGSVIRRVVALLKTGS